VRGKLTRQAASDEPASELLKRIQAEKARLVEAGEIRDSDPLSAIQEDEQAFELAEGWAWTRLGSVAVVGTGSTPRRDQPDYYEDGTVAWITSCATNHPFVSQADEYITEVAVRDTRLRVYPKHTLLVALYGQGKTRGQVSELLIEATINQACAAMVFEGEMSGLRQYTKTFLLKHYHELREQAAGAAQPNLNLNKPKQTVMPLPPLTEQQRIVARVEQLLGLCDALEAKLQAAQTQREKLVAAVVVGVSNPPPGLWPGGAPSGERGWG
jgi:type I restriction enzyme S subunit